jgi:hypothetical protein
MCCGLHNGCSVSNWTLRQTEVRAEPESWNLMYAIFALRIWGTVQIETAYISIKGIKEKKRCKFQSAKSCSVIRMWFIVKAPLYVSPVQKLKRKVAFFVLFYLCVRKLSSHDHCSRAISVDKWTVGICNSSTDVGAKVWMIGTFTRTKFGVTCVNMLSQKIFSSLKLLITSSNSNCKLEADCVYNVWTKENGNGSTHEGN